MGTLAGIGGLLPLRESGHPNLQRTQKAAQEFEAQLLSALLGPLEESFSAVPGEAGGAGADDYSYMAVQALANGVAASGGLGIARMLIGALQARK